MVAAWPQRGLRINKSQLRELIPGGGNSLPQARNRIREWTHFCRGIVGGTMTMTIPGNRLRLCKVRRDASFKFIAVYRSSLFPVNALYRYAMTRKEKNVVTYISLSLETFHIIFFFCNFIFVILIKQDWNLIRFIKK